MPLSAAISRWVRGGLLSKPYRMVMIIFSRSSKHSSTSFRTWIQESRASKFSSISSSTLMTSIRDRAFPSPSESNVSDRETSPCSFFCERKCIRISFSMHREA